MFVIKSLGVNEDNSLTMGGLDVAGMAREYGTPLYLMDEDIIRENCRAYVDAMKEHYGGNGYVSYASKTFLCVQMCKIIAEEGLGLDVVSGGELYTAIKAGFPMERVYFHGNNKTNTELRSALENNIGTIVVDNLPELERLSVIAGLLGKTASVAFRIKPGVEAHTHEFIKTGQIDSKFGVALDNGEAEEILLRAVKMPNIKVYGVHCHIGSQIFGIEPFIAAAEKLVNFIGDLKAEHGIEIEELNLGGGYGIKYTEEDTPIQYGEYIKSIAVSVKNLAEDRGIKLPKIAMEPGRSITGPAGITVYTVGSVKEIPGIRTYVAVDGGMGDNPRHILYDSVYDAVTVRNPKGKADKTVTIAGRYCESGDVLVRDITLPEVKSGDLVAVLATGAYNYSMASNYNRVPRPPVVMIKGGEARVVVKRETYDDIISNDIL